MTSVGALINESQQYLHDIEKICQEEYSKIFDSFFSVQKNLYYRLKSEDRPITDSELEEILTQLPLDLLCASEHINLARLDCEVLKLKVKEDTKSLKDLEDNLKSCKDSPTDANILKSEISRIEENILGSNLNIKIKSYLADRADAESSFTRELIMSAKKIWDSRKASEQSVPVSDAEYDVNNPSYDTKKSSGSKDVKDYVVNPDPYISKSYVKG